MTGAHRAETGRVAVPGGDKENYVKPMNPVIWRGMIAALVLIYGSYSVLVHMCEDNGKLAFSSTSFVLIVELSKFTMSVCMFIPEYRMKGLDVPSIRSAAVYAVPAVLYFINNNLAVHMQMEMDPATYNVLCNLKILSTAILYKLILKRGISPLQWFSLFMLAGAGALNSYGGLVSRMGTAVVAGSMYITRRGLQMITVYCTLSGLAGVYSEWVLKEKYQMSIHVQNAMLYTFGIMLNGTAWIYTATSSGDSSDLNLLKGYTLFTALLVVNQASCGLLMSSVMKHGSNIVRLFVISGAMIVTMFLSSVLLGLHLNTFILVASGMVLVALYLFYKK